jgi:anaerobic selenocysteine-containing dehydrogenase
MTSLGSVLYARGGALTRELERADAGQGLGQLPRRLLPDATASVVCGFCSTGCGLDVHLAGGEAINLSPSRSYPVNRGAACPKGWEALAPLRATDRATVPLLRDARGRLAPVDWETALETFAGRMKAIQREHGPESLAWLGTGQMPTEELMLLGALGKFGMGILHGDGNTRQCMATSVVAYKQAFGFDAPPYSYADFEHSDVIVLVGSNLCIAHPILWKRIHENPHHPKIIVVDPRRTETAMAATEHLPILPKSDLCLFYGIARLLIERGAVDRDFVARHTTGFDEFAEHVQEFTLERVSRTTGLAPEKIENFARLIAEGRRVSFWWTMGVNQSHEGVRVAQAVIDLALLTGNIGRPGTGANSITGQANAMGSRLFSNTTNLLGGRDFASAEQREHVAKVLGIDAGRIPASSSLTYDQILERILAGKIKGLWVIATNPAHSWINQSDARAVLARLDFLVVQDMYATTETASMADLVLPAAGWGEKEGTFINSERRIGLIQRVARAPGEALADFYIFKLLADAWGVGDLFRRWTSPEAVFHLMRELSRGQPCDITGIRGYADLVRLGGVQWPWPEGAHSDPEPERRLFEDGHFHHPDGRARFVFEQPRPLPEPTTSSYPLTLLTGRGSSSEWHTRTRTDKSAVLRKLHPSQPYVELNPADARDLGITAQSWVIVETRRGELRARAVLTHVVKPGEIFVPMHYPDVNKLTFASFDPYSRQPSYKACAARVRKAELHE